LLNIFLQNCVTFSAIFQRKFWTVYLTIGAQQIGVEPVTVSETAVKPVKVSVEKFI